MNICVFASSSPVDRRYLDEVKKLGGILSENKHSLIFGGYNAGLMGAAADGFAEHGAEIIGVISKVFGNSQTTHPKCTRLVMTEDLAGRKTEMEKISDAFIAVPGGIGTFDELFDVVALKQLGLLRKPIILFNIDGFYDNLYKSICEMQKKHFVKTKPERLIFISESAEEIAEYIAESEKKA